MTKQINFVVASWGDKYLNRLIQYLLPSLISKNNIPKYKSRYNYSFTIFIDQDNTTHLKNYSIFMELNRYCNIELIAIETLNISLNDFASHWDIWRFYIKNIYKDGPVFFFQSDHYYEDGAISLWIDDFETGFAAIYSPGGMVVEELFNNYFNCGTPPLINSDNISKFYLDNCHPLVLTNIYSSSNRMLHLDTMNFRGAEGEFSKQIYTSHPIAVDPKKIALSENLCPLHDFHLVHFDVSRFLSIEPFFKSFWQYWDNFPFDNEWLKLLGPWANDFMHEIDFCDLELVYNYKINTPNTKTKLEGNTASLEKEIKTHLINSKNFHTIVKTLRSEQRDIFANILIYHFMNSDNNTIIRMDKKVKILDDDLIKSSGILDKDLNILAQEIWDYAFNEKDLPSSFFDKNLRYMNPNFDIDLSKAVESEKIHLINNQFVESEKMSRPLFETIFNKLNMYKGLYKNKRKKFLRNIRSKLFRNKFQKETNLPILTWPQLELIGTQFLFHWDRNAKYKNRCYYESLPDLYIASSIIRFILENSLSDELVNRIKSTYPDLIELNREQLMGNIFEAIDNGGNSKKLIPILIRYAYEIKNYGAIINIFKILSSNNAIHRFNDNERFSIVQHTLVACYKTHEYSFGEKISSQFSYDNNYFNLLRGKLFAAQGKNMQALQLYGKAFNWQVRDGKEVNHKLDISSILEKLKIYNEFR